MAGCAKFYDGAKLHSCPFFFFFLPRKKAFYPSIDGQCTFGFCCVSIDMYATIFPHIYSLSLSLSLFSCRLSCPLSCSYSHTSPPPLLLLFSFFFSWTVLNCHAIVLEQMAHHKFLLAPPPPTHSSSNCHCLLNRHHQQGPLNFTRRCLIPVAISIASMMKIFPLLSHTRRRTH